MARLNLLSPWVQFYYELCAMFRRDPDIKIILDEDHDEIKLYVDSPQKAAALKELLPAEKTFGEVRVVVTVIPGNSINTREDGNVFERAFDGNPAFAYSRVIDGILSNPLMYVVFDNVVVQYYTDNLGDIHGVRSTLYQDIAREIFNPIEGVYYCTDVSSDNMWFSFLSGWPY